MTMVSNADPGDGNAAAPAARPSASARHIALLRARLTRPLTSHGDPHAEDLLLASLAADQTPFERFLAARTEFFDRELLSALRAGMTQVVVLGAGYDGRALRYKSPGVRYVEVDLPVTQADKVRRLNALRIDTTSIDFAAADLATERVQEVLPRTAFDPGTPAVFLCEGVLLYLPGEAVAMLLAGLAAQAAPGSLLLVSFAIGSFPPDRRGTSGEQRQTFRTPAGAMALLSDCGWLPARTAHPDPARTSGTDVALFVRAVAGG